ncbi:MULTISPECIES: flagellar protein FliT [Halomonadaceae]|uniref:flagellar protein FliT n=1 Tax=Halomonadaceae TaxID=28256 RepID=UPI001599E550|nr:MULTISPECIES: flagellar protein FliT [Halomonas]QJQ94407.1 flagellar protein FliT [Halomonas sp. PA5]
MSEMIASYQSLLSSAARLLEALKRSDWDALTDLEAEYREQFERVQNADATPQQDPTILRRKQQLLGELLEHDREIRKLMGSRREELSRLMNITRRQGKLHRAYGAHSQ